MDCAYISRKMERVSASQVFLLGIAVLALEAQARTAAFADSSARAVIQQVVEQTFRLEYDQALSSAASLDSLLPGHPVVPLLKVGVLYCRMLDFEDMLDLKEFDAHYAVAWQESEELKKSGEIAEGELYLGVLLGFKALLHQRLGQWWPAVKQGMRAIGHLNSCLEKDPGYADAYLGVGTYKYWRSRATDFINWLPFIPDEKQEGIAMVRRAMNEGLFGREISRSTLAWILIDAGRPSEAVTLSLEGLKFYPGSRFYLWTLADGYLHTGQWRKAAATFQKLYDLIHAEQRNNHYNELGICKQMARCYQNIREPKLALEWVERGLALTLDDEVKERRKKDVERLISLKASLEKQLAETENPSSSKK